MRMVELVRNVNVRPWSAKNRMGDSAPWKARLTAISTDPFRLAEEDRFRPCEEIITQERLVLTRVDARVPTLKSLAVVSTASTAMGFPSVHRRVAVTR